jgi:glycosyltransferase involved in cell wall biosynthesis
VVASNIIKALARRGHDVAIFPINPINTATVHPEDVEYIRAGFDRQRSYDPSATSIRLWHQHDLAQHVGKGLRINFPIFELDRFNEVELHHLKNSDILFVCSDWAKDIIAKNGIEVPTYVVPLGTDREIFNENVKPLIYKNKRTIFLNVGKIEHRKGHDILIKAFQDAFIYTDEVELWMVWNNPFLTYNEVKEWESKYLDGKMGHRVRIFPSRYVNPKESMPRFNHPTELARLMAGADCLVQPSRAEGWGLPSLDALSMGLHLITTDYSAHRMYANEYNSHLIKIDAKEPANDGKWFHGQGDWAKFGSAQIDSLINHMRSIHKKKQSGELGLNMSGVQTAKMYTWDNTANIIIDTLNKIVSA